MYITVPMLTLRLRTSISWNSSKIHILPPSSVTVYIRTIPSYSSSEQHNYRNFVAPPFFSCRCSVFNFFFAPPPCGFSGSSLPLVASGSCLDSSSFSPLKSRGLKLGPSLPPAHALSPLPLPLLPPLPVHAFLGVGPRLFSFPSPLGLCQFMRLPGSGPLSFLPCCPF